MAHTDYGTDTRIGQGVWGVWEVGRIIVAVSFCACLPRVLAFWSLKLKS
ncbi:MAG: hypothetical protein SWX82_28470 [Cyanobacteriota bacterium]|nr:hypothetical protein [Cyanobacteriota bacterium]